MTHIFRGTMSEDGVVQFFSPLLAMKYRAHLHSLRGKPVEVSVRRASSQRSLDQNAWVWGCAYPLLCETLGYDMHERDDLHYALVEKCFGSHIDPRLGVNVPNKRSSQLTTAEFSEYMEWLVRFAAQEFQCVIPLPNEVEVTP